MELDHLFICTAIDAPAAETLRQFGLVEGTPNTHPGQGSANRRFFFRNFMLELLWVHDVEEARTQPIHLADRWLQRHTHCPFGLCLRPSANRQAPALQGDEEPKQKPPPCNQRDPHPDRPIRGPKPA